MDLQLSPAKAVRWVPDDRARRPQVVILDRGDSASLVCLSAAAPLAMGDCVRHRGLTWRITAYRDHARAFVAHLRTC